jgi:hypothetical protein
MTTENTALTVQARAALALESSTAETYLTELAVKSKAITAITNKDGRTECHAAAMTAKEARVSIEKAGKSAREDATAFSKAVISEEARLVALIKPEETRLIELRDEWDAKVKAEKEAADDLERQRIEAIKDRIAEFGAMVTDAAMLEAHGAEQELEVAIAVEINVESFGEFYGDAVEAKASAVAKLREMVAAKTAAEATAARIKAEQEAEAARLAEEAKRLAAERAELDRQRKEIADAHAEQARIFAAEQADRNRIAAEEIRKIDEQRKAEAMERAKQLAEEANAAMPDEAQKQTVADHIEQPLALVDQFPDATKMIDDRSGPRITSLRIQISEELGKMNVFELGNVLAYCQALPLKNRLAA